MSDIIHLLPDSVANQIAAGEVIQRPASCLKELVENSIDAGAKHVRIIVRDGGRTLLQVIDNGKGMSPTDVRMAFERHATSKISQAADLFALHTMGFRGEALASICAVAHVEVITRQEDAEVGTRLELAGSEIITQETVQCPVGTNMRVKNLFYNMPARRKFLKTDQTELRNLLMEYHRIVLVNPAVQFTFVHNDEIISELPISSLKQRIEAVFGHTSKPYTGHLVDIATHTELVNIYGFVGKPETAGKNSQQYMFVNGRYMRHSYFHKAIITAFSGLLAVEHSPSYFIYFEVNPEAIDVNIHPAKTEIKFADEQAIFQILLATIREALGKFNVAPSLDFTNEVLLDIPQAATNPANLAIPRIQVNPSYNPFKQSGARPSPQGWETLYTQPIISEETFEQEVFLFSSKHIDENTPIFQWRNSYIFIPMEEGLMMVHQHRAHVAILYKELLAQLQNQQGVTQTLLFPEIIELSNQDIVTLQTMLPDLQTIGFGLDQFSPTAYSITSVPVQLGQINPVDTLSEVIHYVQDCGGTVQQHWQEKMALALAEKMAIHVGKSLSEIEMRDLLARLAEKHPMKYLSNGQTIISILTHEEIQKRFY